MVVKLLTEHHLDFVSLKGGCTGSSESTHVKCHCWKSHAMAQYSSHLLVFGHCVSYGKSPRAVVGGVDGGRGREWVRVVVL